MKKGNKIIYIIVGILAVVFLFVIANIAINNLSTHDEKDTGTAPEGTGIVEPAKLPSKKELKSLRLENVMQTNKLNDRFKLNDYAVDGAAMKYNFLEDNNSLGKTLTVTAKSENIAEYELTLPVSDRVEKVNVDKYEMTFYNRMVYFVENENTELSDVIKSNISNGHVEIRYNGSSPELVSAQSIYWYDEENSIAYTMEVLARNLSKDEMTALASDYINNSRK